MGYNRGGHARTQRLKRRARHLKRLAAKGEKKVTTETKEPTK